MVIDNNQHYKNVYQLFNFVKLTRNDRNIVLLKKKNKIMNISDKILYHNSKSFVLLT